MAEVTFKFTPNLGRPLINRRLVTVTINGAFHLHDEKDFYIFEMHPSTTWVSSEWPNKVKNTAFYLCKAKAEDIKIDGIPP